MDSGIKVHPDVITEIAKMKETAKNPFDFYIATIETDPEAPPPKASKSPIEVVLCKDKVLLGECAKKYEESGTDLKGIPANYQGILDYVKEGYKENCCMILFYLAYKKDGRDQDKLAAINWVPDTASMKLKMRYSSTFKTLCTKAPKVNHKLEAHDYEDIEYKAVVEKCLTK